MTTHSTSALAACFDYAHGKPRGRVPSQSEIRKILEMLDANAIRIDALEKRIDSARPRGKTKQFILALCDRIHKQSELLSRKDNKCTPSVKSSKAKGAGPTPVATA